MSEKSDATFYKRLLLSRAWMFCILYLICCAIMFALGVWRNGFEDTRHVSNLIVLGAIALAFGLEHLHHRATRKP